MSIEFTPFLAVTQWIDWQHPAVLAKAQALAAGLPDQVAIAAACYHFVRDEISHSWDAQRDPVTCAASQVLAEGTGYCYAKSHLLAALLRANGIPAGLCYQRLTIRDDQPPFCLHGLNALYLAEFGWYRVDARGNRADVYAEFCPPREQLAFPIRSAGEADLPEIWAEPLPVVVETLTRYHTFQQVAEHLPDVLLWRS